MKKISIMIPTYNAERTLKETLESIYLSEAYMTSFLNMEKIVMMSLDMKGDCKIRIKIPELEIIIVDGGSTDNTGKLIMEYQKKDPRIRTAWLNATAGIMTARKTGVMMAEGDYLMFLDADDYFFPETLTKAFFNMETASVDMIQFASRIIVDGPVPVEEIALKEKKLNLAAADYQVSENNPYAILNACYREHRFTYTLWNKIYRMELAKEAFARIPEERLIMGEDMYAFFLIASRAKSLSIISDQLYGYRFGRGISCVNTENPWDAFEKSLEAMLSLQELCFVLERDQEEAALKEYLPSIRMELLTRTLSRFYVGLNLNECEIARSADRSLRYWWTDEELYKAGYYYPKGNNSIVA